MCRQNYGLIQKKGEMPMIKLNDVSYTYMKGGPFEKKALDSVNLEIDKGEFIGLIGHTGSGKSTLIQLLNGLLKPDCGEVFIDGVNIWDKSVKLKDIRFKVGLVMQYPEYQLFEETVYKDIAFGPKNMKLSDREIEDRVEYAASLAGVSSELLNKSPFDLSGGQKRRAAIAGVIAMQPKVLILDEPTAGLDPAGREEILYKISDMHKMLKLTVILVSHSMDDVARFANRILVMNSGRVEMFDSPSRVFAKAEQLTKMGLAVPHTTVICEKLRQLGMPVKSGIHTVEEAAYNISQILLGGDGVC